MLSSINQNNSALLGQSFDCSFQSFQMTTKKKLTAKNLFKTPTKLPTLSRKLKKNLQNKSANFLKENLPRTIVRSEQKVREW